MEVTVNERVKLLRKHLNMPQREFAAKVGTSFGTISKVENGVTEPQFATLNKIIQVFSVSRDWLVNGTGEMFTNGESAPVEVSSWKDEAFESLKDQVNHLKTEIEWLRDMLKLSMGGKQASANFNNGIALAGLNKVGNTVRVAA